MNFFKKLWKQVFGPSKLQRQVNALQQQIFLLQHQITDLQNGVPWSPFISVDAPTGDLLVHGNIRAAGDLTFFDNSVTPADNAQVAAMGLLNHLRSTFP